MKPKADFSLCLVTDVEDCVEQAILGGVTIVQLREKNADSLEFYQKAQRLRALTKRLNVPLIINDRADIALAVNADGVHIGQKDLPYNAVRRIIGQDKIIGVSASNLKEALSAAEMGADYLGIGAMFATPTKPDAQLTSLNELRHIRQAVHCPIIVIGGINSTTMVEFKGYGIDGVAVVSAIIDHPNPKNAARAIAKNLKPPHPTGYFWG